MDKQELIAHIALILGVMFIVVEVQGIDVTYAHIAVTLIFINAISFVCRLHSRVNNGI